MTDKPRRGQAGGKKIVQLYGRDYMVKLGKKGAARFYEKYQWRAIPVGTWALVRKSDGKIIRVLNQRPF